MNTVRSEKDSMGAIDVPADKLWGAQTQRSLEHFRISTEKMPVSLIHALALTKRAAAKVNDDLGLLAADKAGQVGLREYQQRSIVSAAGDGAQCTRQVISGVAVTACQLHQFNFHLGSLHGGMSRVWCAAPRQ